MKKNLLSVFIVLSSFAAVAQCDPTAHDWGSATFGVSPDPNQGENFAPAILNVPYSEVVYVKCPTNAQDINPNIPFPVDIDSVSLDSVTINNGINDLSISAVGLYLTCNNNDDSPNPCMFMPGGAYCGDIMGTPTVAGTFPVKIYITAYFNFAGPQVIPYAFDNYTLVINDPSSVGEEAELSVSLSQNSPNPASIFTNINFELSRAEETRIQVHTLLGEKMFDKKIMGKRGENSYKMDTSHLQTGIYLYSITSGDKKFTRRMIVQQ